MTDTSDSPIDRADHRETGWPLPRRQSRVPCRRADVRTAFSFEDKTYIRAFVDHESALPRNESMGAWLVSCVSTVSEWNTNPYRCEGCLTAEEALDWGERLWRPRPLG